MSREVSNLLVEQVTTSEQAKYENNFVVISCALYVGSGAYWSNYS
jgi:hypothetical protein